MHYNTETLIICINKDTMQSRILRKKFPKTDLNVIIIAEFVLVAPVDLSPSHSHTPTLPQETLSTVSPADDRNMSVLAECLSGFSPDDPIGGFPAA